MIYSNVDIDCTKRTFDWGSIYQTSSLGMFDKNNKFARAITLAIPEELLGTVETDPFFAGGTLDEAATIGMTKSGKYKIKAVKEDSKPSDTLYLILSSSTDVTPESNTRDGIVSVVKGDEKKFTVMATGTGIGTVNSAKPEWNHRWNCFLIKIQNFSKTQVLFRVRYSTADKPEYICINNGCIYTYTEGTSDIDYLDMTEFDLSTDSVYAGIGIGQKTYNMEDWVKVMKPRKKFTGNRDFKRNNDDK